MQVGKVRSRGGWWHLPLAYADAARLAPRAFATALWWRILGKRVRARGHFAPLLSASRHAYAVWLSREALPAGSGTGPAILALVAPGAGRAATLASLAAESVPVIGNAADAAPGSWLLPLYPGDVLATGAAALYRAATADTAADILYADDDLLVAGRRTGPHFKPGWNAELFAHHDYLAGTALLRARDSLVGSDAAALLRAAIAASDQPPQHLPHVLHHRHARPAPTLPPRPLAVDRQALPPVSIVIPTRNRVDLLRQVTDGLARTDYPATEIIIVDNGSDDPATLRWLSEWAARDPACHIVLPQPGPFNYSALNNHAVRQATGELVCLLNNDIEMIGPDWLAIMAQQALRPEVGAVGARLLYPDGRIQHAGVVMGVGNAAGHAHRFLRPEVEGWHHRHSLPHFVSAVTAACLVVRRDRFEAVSGLDEANFAVAFNDVDLCLRLNQRGWQSLYEPRATLVHHESVSRGLDRDPVGAARFAGELAALKRIWGTETLVDPWHHPELSRATERFSVGL
ncbi:glycosyltransferase family 2 protein [Croceibacterium sp. TMG7-5b_MA50]|uniref:glycosyltransferase family 2 protein n=1 Tax=Croceibacterium sp. TMG7-5b_MA50 TaxID=3121290 RepID=UPI00322178D6